MLNVVYILTTIPEGLILLFLFNGVTAHIGSGLNSLPPDTLVPCQSPPTSYI